MIAGSAGVFGTIAVLSASQFLSGAPSDATEGVMVATVLAGPDRPMPSGLMRIAPPAQTEAALTLPEADDPRWAHGVEPAKNAFALVDRKANAVAEDDGPVTLAALAKPDPRPAKAAVADAGEAKPAAKAKGSGGPITGRAVIASDVTLRSGPSKSAGAIGTIAANETVDIIKCASWCEVSTGGRRGYIYSGFLKGGPAKKGSIGTLFATDKAAAPDKVKSSATLEPKPKWSLFPKRRTQGGETSVPVPAFN